MNISGPDFATRKHGKGTSFSLSPQKAMCEAELCLGAVEGCDSLMVLECLFSKTVILIPIRVVWVFRLQVPSLYEVAKILLYLVSSSEHLTLLTQMLTVSFRARDGSREGEIKSIEMIQLEDISGLRGENNGSHTLSGYHYYDVFVLSLEVKKNISKTYIK